MLQRDFSCLSKTQWRSTATVIFIMWNRSLFENSVNYAQSSIHLSSSWRNMLKYRHTHTQTHAQTLSSFPELLFLYLICVLLNMVIIMKGLSCTWFNLFLCLFSALLLYTSGVCVCVRALVHERDTVCVLMSVCLSMRQ